MAEEYRRSPNPHRLYRNKERGVVAGVCAGVADYFGLDLAMVRIGTIIGLIFLTPPTLIGYIIAAIVIPARERPVRRPLSEEEDKFWRDVERSPHVTLSGIRYRFRTMEERLRDIERVVTSDEWKLRRDFREIE